MAKSGKSKKTIIPNKRNLHGKTPVSTGKKSKPGKGTKKPIQADKPSSSSNGFPIVGIGSSAGGLEAIKQLLEGLPVDTGMSFIFVQHLDPSHQSMAPEIFSRSTKMPVCEAEDGMRVLPNHVYTNPPSFSLAVVHGVLSLQPRTETRGQHMAIDFFFHSLAQDQKGKAIGVVLSGTASDGTQGLMAIKAEGGLALVQDPKSAKYDGMPNSAIASGIVDLILPPEGIAKDLARIATHPYIAAVCESNTGALTEFHDPAEDKENVESEPDEALRTIFLLLRKHTQINFSDYKHTTLRRRIQRRMMVRKTESLSAYAKYLQDNPDEVKALYADILINVTEFFRDPDAFLALKDHVFPQLIKDRSNGAPIRIWVPGCSTGEEAYSLAILLIECLDDARVKIPIQIFATDISDSAIQKARAGFYSAGIESAVSKERLNKFFDKVDGGYKINKAIRDLCLISKHDVTSDPPFSKLDLVSCRNMLIYFTATLQKRVIPIFHYALNPGGFLFLGASENPGMISTLFAVVDKTHKIYSKTNVPASMPYRFPENTYVPKVDAVLKIAPERAKGGSDFQKDADRIALFRFAPPSVVVNADMEILQFRGRTAPYLESASGIPSTNLLKMARQEILHGLRNTIQAAAKQNTTVRKEGLSFEVDGKRRTVNIEVIPANPLARPSERNFLIFFEEVSSVTPLPEQAKSALRGKQGLKKGQDKNLRDKQSQRISQLKQDASASKQYHQSMSEEFEAAQEELTAANEELQSTNEELQSTNEEMETAKEEIQSSNEELTTVNEELQNRNTELAVLSNDLNNLLSSVEIPILIVGNDHRIRRFTPKAEKVFRLIASDVGRPIGDIKNDFDLNLDALISQVSNSLISQEKEIKDRQGRWMRLQIRPYKTFDNRIDGAVISLVDIEALKQQIVVAKKAQDYLTSVSETVRLPLVILDDQLRLRSANLAFWEHFKLSQQITGKDFSAILEMRGDSLQEMRKLLTETLRVNKNIKNVEMDCEFPHIGRRTLLISASLIQWMGEMLKEPPASQEPAALAEPQAILLTFDDITERRHLEKALARESKNVRLFEAVTVAANEATTFDAALQIFLDRICAHATWPVGHAYLLANDGSSEFIPSNVWHLDDPKKFARFKEGTELSKLAPGVGLARKVSTTRKPVLILDLMHDPAFPGAKLVEGTGIKSAFGFPVVVGGSIVAVLEFLSAEEKEPNQRLIEVITHVIPQLGQVFERKRSEKGLVQLFGKEQDARLGAEGASQYKTEFLANMSHELRTPLNSSLILSKLLAENAGGNLTGEQIQYALSIHSAGTDLLNLINDILDLSKVEAGKIEIIPKIVFLPKVLNSLVKTFEPLAKEKKLKFEVTTDRGVPETMLTDLQRLEQILRNLLSNAFKFTEKGHVTLHVSQITDGNPEQRPKKGLTFSVIDTGIGVPKAQQEVIFEAFRQADGTTNRKYGGTGLGLSISRELARLLGGSIEVESAPGEGSRFSLLLPETYDESRVETAAPKAYSSSAAIAMSDSSSSEMAKRRPVSFTDDRGALEMSGRTLLAIEDDLEFAQIIYELAHELHYKCVIAQDAKEGLELAQSLRPDAIFLNTKLPDRSGVTVLNQLKEDPTTRHIPVVVASVHNYREKALEMGAIGYIQKPSTREVLQDAFAKFESKFSQKVKRVLLVENDKPQRERMVKLISEPDVEITVVALASEAPDALKKNDYDCMVVDLKLPDMSGEQLLKKMTEQKELASFPPVVVYTDRSLSRDEEYALRKYSHSIIIKSAKSAEKLLDEVSLFLHSVDSKLSPEKQEMLKSVRNREDLFEGRQILVVDDDVRNIFALTAALEQKGANIEVARNGKEALEKLKEYPRLDLVLMDIMMPVMDGYQATREIRKQERFAKLPIIAVTAKATKNDQALCMEAGADDYLAKPIDIDQLLSLIRVWMPKLGRD